MNKIKTLAILIIVLALLISCANQRNVTTNFQGNTVAEEVENTLTTEDLELIERVTALWEETNIPATTNYTINNVGYFDDPDFMPNIVYFPAKEGVPVKGAILICAGGAFQFRGDNEATPVAQGLSELGYQCFVVNYRLRPYTQQEGALDLARAVRYVRKNADALGMDEKDIATIGFSAGGILCGEQALNFKGLTNGTSLDKNYSPDELDNISADVAAVGMIYSFYGRLSVASLDVEKFRESNLPPTYFLYGSEEVFRSQIEACARATTEAGVVTETRMLDGMRHGFGAYGNWFNDFDKWLEEVFKNN